MSESVNIYKIASMANVSAATVSKVINGKEGVGEGTRDRILALIKEYDFQPKISSNVADIIGLVYRVDAPSIAGSNYLMNVIAGITDTLYGLSLIHIYFFSSIIVHFYEIAVSDFPLNVVFQHL